MATTRDDGAVIDNPGESSDECCDGNGAAGQYRSPKEAATMIW